MAKLNSEIRGLTIGGIDIPVKDGTFSWNMGGVERTSVHSKTKRIGATEAGVPGSCSFTGVYRKGDIMKDLYDQTDTQVRMITNQGNEWLMTGADLMNPADISTPDGDIEVTYEGNPWEQI